MTNVRINTKPVTVEKQVKTKPRTCASGLIVRWFFVLNPLLSIRSRAHLVLKMVCFEASASQPTEPHSTQGLSSRELLEAERAVRQHYEATKNEESSNMTQSVEKSAYERQLEEALHSDDIDIRSSLGQKFYRFAKKTDEYPQLKAQEGSNYEELLFESS